MRTPAREDAEKFKMFGLAYSKYTSEGDVYPVVPNSTLTDELSMLPSDKYVGYGFMVLEDPTEITNTPGGSVPLVSAKLAIICFVDLKRFMGFEKWMSDIRQYQQDFRNLVLKAVSMKMHSIGGAFQVIGFVDQRIDDVFKGFRLNPESVTLYQQPYYMIRFEGKLNYVQRVC